MRLRGPDSTEFDAALKDVVELCMRSERLKTCTVEQIEAVAEFVESDRRSRAWIGQQPIADAEVVGSAQ